MTHLLVVTTDPYLRQEFTGILRHADDRVFNVADPLEALTSTIISRVDLIIFDARCEQPLVQEACRILRKRNQAVGVVVLLAGESQDAATKLFDAGADDCVRLPCKQSELAVRLMAVYRRITCSQGQATRATTPQRFRTAVPPFMPSARYTQRQAVARIDLTSHRTA